MKKCALILLLMATMIFSLVSCGKKELQTFDGVPDEAVSVARTYLEAFRKGTKNASQYCYFATKESENAYREAENQWLESYEIQKIEKLNDSLYVVTVYGKLNVDSEARTAYHYVGMVDGQWQYILNIGNIPEALKTNVDFSPYDYSDNPDIL